MESRDAAGDFIYVAGMRGIDPAQTPLSKVTNLESAKHSSI
jgi:hypothetical protein